MKIDGQNGYQLVINYAIGGGKVATETSTNMVPAHVLIQYLKDAGHSKSAEKLEQAMKEKKRAYIDLVIV